MFDTQEQLFEDIASKYPNNGVVVMMQTTKLGNIYIFNNDDEELLDDTLVIYKDNGKWYIADNDKAKASSIMYLEQIKLLSEAIEFEEDIFDPFSDDEE